MTEAEQSFDFDLADLPPGPLPGRRGEGSTQRPIASLLRGFSAPVILERETTDAERAFLLAHDTDPFARWEAGRGYGIDIALGLLRGEQVPTEWTQALGNLLADETLDPAFKAMALDAPGEEELAAEIAGRGEPVDPEAGARRGPRHAPRPRLGAGRAAGGRPTTRWQRPAPTRRTPSSAGRRALRNRAMALLAQSSEAGCALADRQFEAADNMSEALPALTALVHCGAPTAAARLAEFHERWKARPAGRRQMAGAAGDLAAAGRARRASGRWPRRPDFEWKNPNKFRAPDRRLRGGEPGRASTPPTARAIASSPTG